MKLNEVKDYTLGVLRGTFKNKNVLDKISAEGKNLRFDGKNLGDSYMFEGVENYSEDEIIVGRWIDGKPIYRKVFDITFPASGKSSEIPFANIGIQNVADIVNIYGTIFKTDGYTIIINAGTFTDSAFMDCNLSKQILWLHSEGTAGGCSGKAMVEYTKTTDAPGSSSDLINAPTNFVDGGTYSENEVVVGQWMNGKPIYRKCFETTIKNGVLWDVTSNKIEELVNICGKTLHTNGNQCKVPYGAGNGDYIHLYLTSDNKSIYCVYAGSWMNNAPVSISIDYTKTTDEPQDMSITSTLTTVASDEEVAEVFK